MYGGYSLSGMAVREGKASAFAPRQYSHRETGHTSGADYRRHAAHLRKLYPLSYQPYICSASRSRRVEDVYSENVCLGRHKCDVELHLDVRRLCRLLWVVKMPSGHAVCGGQRDDARPISTNMSRRFNTHIWVIWLFSPPGAGF